MRLPVLSRYLTRMEVNDKDGGEARVKGRERGEGKAEPGWSNFDEVP